jgi:hypothetical protein
MVPQTKYLERIAAWSALCASLALVAAITLA